MAKLKAPLLSLGASGAIGKSLVFFNWKGLDVVREYVVPTNPNSTDQGIQRTYLKNIIALIHVAMQYALHALSDADKVALALWGSCYPTPRTWFNQLVKMNLDMKVAGKLASVMTDGTTDTGVATLAFSIWSVGDVITAGRFYYGKSKNCVDGWKASADAAGNHTAVIGNLTPGVKYYWQFQSTSPDTYDTIKSGVYYDTPK